jgi:RNA polymerase sigma-70 factor, ECF subfamily
MKKKINEELFANFSLNNRVSGSSGEQLKEFSDEDLVELCLNGEYKGFSIIYKRYYFFIYRIAYGMTANAESAEDLTQEIFIRLFQKLDKFEFQSRFSTWFYRLAFNYSLNYRQKNRHAESQMSEEESLKIEDKKLLGTEESFFKQELQRQVHKALLTLAPKYRLVIILKDIVGLTYDEVAEQMDLSPGTVASRLNKARAMLAQKLIHLKGVI